MNTNSHSPDLLNKTFQTNQFTKYFNKPAELHIISQTKKDVGTNPMTFEEHYVSYPKLNKTELKIVPNLDLNSIPELAVRK